jgi:hypothetical protein
MEDLARSGGPHRFEPPLSKTAGFPARCARSAQSGSLGIITGGHFSFTGSSSFFRSSPFDQSGLGLDDVQVGALNSARQFTQGTLDLPLGMLSDAAVRRRGVLASARPWGAAYFRWHRAGFFCSSVRPGGIGNVAWHPAAAPLSNRFPERRATALAVQRPGATLGDTRRRSVGLFAGNVSLGAVLWMQLAPALFWRTSCGMGSPDFTGAESAPWRSADFREIYVWQRTAFSRHLRGHRSLQMGRLSTITFLPIYLRAPGTPSFSGLHALLHAMGTIRSRSWLSLRPPRPQKLPAPSFVVLGILFLLLAAAAPGLQLALVIGAIGLFSTR